MPVTCLPARLLVDVPVDVPVDLTREQAHRLAQHELADPAYRAARPSLVQRAIEWLVDEVQRLLERAGELAPGGWLGILGLVALVVLAVLVVRWRMGPTSGSGTVIFRVDPGTSAAQYRARAGELAAAGQWEAAVSARMQAIVRRSQERGLVDSQPGWTADEVATAVGNRLPTTRPQLLAAARVFDDTRYGGRPASAQTFAVVAEADDLVERTPTPVESGAPLDSSTGAAAGWVPVGGSPADRGAR